MPKVTPSIPNDLLLARLSDRTALDDALWLIPPQVGMLLGRSTDQLEEDRKAGNPPPAMKPWGEKGPVRYRLGTVRDYMLGPAATEYANTTAARIDLARRATAGIKGFATVNDWMDGARWGDEWPFLVRKHRPPIDFFKSLGLGDALSDSDEVRWLTLEAYLQLRKEAALAQLAVDEKSALADGTRGTSTAEPSADEESSGFENAV